MASSEKRCLYEVLGLSKDCSPDEIRSAYRKLALQRHPDKLVKSAGLSEAEATAQFQELVHAYEVLSDPKERAWYDSHRSQILFSDHGSKSGGIPGNVPDLFAFFSNAVYSGYSDTGKGFYRVYSDLFDSVCRNEVSFAKKLGLRMDSVKEAPIMGNLESPYAQVTAFYNHWLGFSTIMDFCWVDQWDVMAGVNRKSRRVMEEENKKLRKKAKREYNETVRGLAEFVKKRDKRVIDMVMKKNAEMEKKREEERERRKKMEKERLERARKYEEPEWAKVQEEEEEDVGLYGFEQEDDDDKKKNEEFYCVVCSKKFKSEKQWKNHEQSKKHKEKVMELRESFSDFEEEKEEEEEEEINGFQGPYDEVGELHEKLKDGLTIDDKKEDEAELEEEVSGENSGTGGDDFDVEEDMKESGQSEDEDDEMSILKKMVSGQKNKRKNVSSKVRVENDSDTAGTSEYDSYKSTGRSRKGRKEKGKWYGGEAMADHSNGIPTPADGIVDSSSGVFDHSQKDEEDFMEYDNRKRTGKNHKGKKGREKKNRGEPMMKDINVTKSGDEDDAQDKFRHMEESHPEALDRDENVGQTQEFNHKDSSHFHDIGTKSKKSSKGKKSKSKEKNPSNLCDRCGEEFESRNKLHKHLADTGHSTLKSR
ncbi:PREDICTED: DNAJ protein JJJ1 homolog [Tarenaya hassleriana]|uniref:DNAJ protein JJJ1 homolog n=1 Tax=Tarenaya hassleriana TaxID=28532 RepID=UPI00053C3A52|nr:PREDICTED: DNAJ protein JJJ1 homolog [Tarenaya hassleriana]